ncbi:MAG: hypothetical protein JSV03_06210, partial [Planctomycetota bacterium]
MQTTQTRAKMPIMYQVFSLQRPGRPQWTLAACLVLLLLTAGMAAGLIAYKKRLHNIPLDDTKLFHNAGIKARLPVNWKRSPIELIPGALAYLVEPGNPPRYGRQLILFQVWQERQVMDSTPELRAITTIIKSIHARGLLKTINTKPDQIGPLPGQTIYAIWLLDRNTRWHILGRVAKTNSGRIIGLIILLPRSPLEPDYDLLSKISKYIE